MFLSARFCLYASALKSANAVIKVDFLIDL